MPRKPGKVPSYCLHKHSGRAVVRIDRRDHYLGEFGSSASHQRYEELIAAWRAAKRGAEAESSLPAKKSPDVTVGELILRFWEHVRLYYVKRGRPTDEQAGIRAALRFVRQLYGTIPIGEFGPLKLKAVRQAMIDAGLSRKVVNQYISRVRRMCRWGAENELIPVQVYQALMTVRGLSKGRSAARETEPIKPAPDAHYKATLPHLTSVVSAMVQFQRLTGCRPGDVCIVRPCDVDTSGDVWCYRPETHKMEHEEEERRIYVGPEAQGILSAWLDRAPQSYCFSPRESAAASLAERRRKKRTPTSQASHPRKRAPGDHYSRFSYRQAIHRACDRAGVPRWNPNQLRHRRATEVRQDHGLEASQTVLGHKQANVTQIYAERNDRLAREIVRKTG